jgi:hypothetical protein
MLLIRLLWESHVSRINKTPNTLKIYGSIYHDKEKFARVRQDTQNNTKTEFEFSNSEFLSHKNLSFSMDSD